MITHNVAKLAVLFVTTILALGACSIETPSEAAGKPTQEQAQDAQTELEPLSARGDATFVTAEVDAEGRVVVDTTALTLSPTFVNYNSNGTNVQLIALIAPDGTPRVALNTCQSCSPSPRAYYVVADETITCQNCGFEFNTDVVGGEASGCNPIHLTSLEQEEGQITVLADELDHYSTLFSKWEGPVE